MDGRTQIPVIRFMQNRYDVQNVDIITEAGPNLILSGKKNSVKAKSIFERIDISVKFHQSNEIAVIAHADCTGNPSHKNLQIIQLNSAKERIQSRYKNVTVIGLWLDEKFVVNEVC